MGERLPDLVFEVFDTVEVLVMSDELELMPEAQGSDPDVVGGNELSSGGQVRPDFSIDLAGFEIGIEEGSLCGEFVDFFEVVVGTCAFICSRTEFAKNDAR